MNFSGVLVSKVFSLTAKCGTFFKMGHTAKTRLPEELEEKACEMALNADTWANIARVLGFNNDMAFFKYRQAYPEFKEKLNQARVDACEWKLEDLILTVVDMYDDPRKAKTMADQIERILRWRMPNKYGQKIELAVTYDILGSLDRAEKRVIDVSPAIALLTPKQNK